MLSSYINPGGNVPKDFECDSYEEESENSLPVILHELLSQSCLVPAMSSYLRNDSGKIRQFSERSEKQAKI